MKSKLFRTPTLLTVLAASALITTGAANSTEIKIIAPNAVKETVAEIGARYSKETDTKLSFTWTGSEAIAKRVGEGEVYDVVLTTSAGVDRLADAGKLNPASKLNFSRSAVSAPFVRECPVLMFRPSMA